jgi:hypothetical protein
MLFEKIIAGCSQNHNNHVIHHGVKIRAVGLIRLLGKSAYSVVSVSSTPSARIFVKFDAGDFHLTLILLTWRIWRAPNNAIKWQMGFNSAYTGLDVCKKIQIWLHMGKCVRQFT